MTVDIEPAMPPQGRPAWPDARWVGMLDLDSAHDGGEVVEIRPRHAQGYRSARLLLRRGRLPLGFVEAPIVDGLVSLTLPPDARPAPPPASARRDPMTVVVCTRDRPDQLADALSSILALDYPDFDVIVVDNAPRTDATARVVERLGGGRVRRVVEPAPGLSRARNTGLRAVTRRWAAFTDDDVVVDRHWLHGIADGFSRSATVSCVSGLVPSGELRTPAQAYYDRRVTWAGSLQPRLYSMADPPDDPPLFPFQVGRFGTGANFAVDRDRILSLGGFDEALGAGTAAQGGEDLDLFFRVLVAGDHLATEPSAIVWHRHRSDNEALLTQARGYGLGLGAWLTKVGLDPDHRRLAARVVRRRFRSSLRAGVGYGSIASASGEFGDEVPSSVGRTEVLAVLSGPKALWQGRRQQKAEPAASGSR